MPMLNFFLPEKPTVLVVDDQPQNLRIIGDLLTGSMGYQVVVADDGRQALSLMESRAPDLILLDMLMPGLNGIETCQLIREKPEWAPIPIIFLSAADDKALIVQALESGGVDYVVKPFSRAELLSRVRTHLALKAARDQLQALAEDKDELLGILTHDLRNHLGGMLMSAQLLQDRADRLPDDKSRRLVENILESSMQMLAFVKEFLANAALERPQELRLQPVDLGDAVTLALRRYQLPAERKNLRLLWTPPPEAVIAQAEPVALNQVLENLLSNAVKFSPPGQSITLSVAAENDVSFIRVADEGPGFTEEDRRTMFRRYGRLSARPTGGEPSTGLGLSIVKKLVELMQGKLSLDSTPGKGAVFTVRLLPASP
jgi:two-component system sensor histidine kinase/response regulator